MVLVYIFSTTTLAHAIIVFFVCLSVPVAAHRIFDLTCGMWYLVPWPGIKPGPLHWEHRVSLDHQGSPPSLFNLNDILPKPKLLIFKNFYFFLIFKDYNYLLTVYFFLLIPNSPFTHTHYLWKSAFLYGEYWSQLWLGLISEQICLWPGEII